MKSFLTPLGVTINLHVGFFHGKPMGLQTCPGNAGDCPNGSDCVGPGERARVNKNGTKSPQLFADPPLPETNMAPENG